MPIDHAQYSPATVEDIVRLRRRIVQAGLPPRRTDTNVIVATWNLQKLGALHPQWSENPGSPKRTCGRWRSSPKRSAAST